MKGINVVAINGNLTRDPELRALPSGSSVCQFGLAWNQRRKDRETGEWFDHPHFFEVTVWGAQGESVAKHLEKGAGVIVRGHIEQDRWETENGDNRQAVKLVADEVVFLPRGQRAEGGGGDDEESKSKRKW